jgi:hypothetical protein
MAAVTEPSWPGKSTLARVRAPRHPATPARRSCLVLLSQTQCLNRRSALLRRGRLCLEAVHNCHSVCNYDQFTDKGAAPHKGTWK